MKVFIPELFISIGETGAMYTLRETYEHWSSIDGQPYSEIWSFHLTNLSTTFDDAVEKAKKYAEANAMKLNVSSNTERELRDIDRAKPRSSEEIEEQRLSEMKAYQDKMDLMRREREAEALELLADDKMPVGKYSGEKLVDCPLGYLNWLVDNVKEFERDSILNKVVDAIKKNFKQLIMPKPNKKKHVGKIGSRCEFKATVIRSFRFDSEWGTTYFTTLVTKDRARNCLMIKSGAFTPEVGEVLSFKATIKAHDVYNGQAQTVVNRAKVTS